MGKAEPGVSYRRQRISAYRYVSPEDEKYLDSSSFKLRTLDALRRKEGVLSDTSEGQSVWNVHRPCPDPEYNPDRKFPPIISNMYKVFNEGHNVLFDSNTFIFVSEERLIYCLSRKYRNLFLERQGLAVCYGIDDVMSFAETIRKSATDILGALRVSKIHYDSKERLNFGGSDFRNDEFVKPLDFFSERELRLSFLPIGIVPDAGHIIVDSPEARQQMRKIR